MAFRSLRLVKPQQPCGCLSMKKDSSMFHPNLSEGGFLPSGPKRRYSNSPSLITPLAEAKRFMKDCFLAVGASADNAETVATNLLEADYRGHYSHGMNRLDMYIRDIQHGTTDATVSPVTLNETVATAHLDGRNGLGAVVGKRAMEIAISKAKDVGIGLVVAKGSNHYGIAGMYALQAIEQGLIGLSVTNTSPLMTPTRAKQATLGTNPLSLGAPGRKGDNFVLDMATTAVALGKIEIAKRKGEPIPEGWALNDAGIPESNPSIAYKYAKLMPLGGTEVNSGYKGYGLGMLVEIFCGILSGSSYGPHVRRWGTSHAVANLGQAFMAINPAVFAPGFEDRLQDLMTYLREMEPVDSGKPVLVHGDKEKAHMEKVHAEGGLRYVPNQHKTNAILAEELKIAQMASETVTLSTDEHDNDIKNNLKAPEICIDITESDEDAVFPTIKSQKSPQENSIIDQSKPDNCAFLREMIKDNLTIEKTVSKGLLEDLAKLDQVSLKTIFSGLIGGISMEELQTVWDCFTGSCHEALESYIRYLLIPTAKQEFAFEVNNVFLAVCQSAPALLKAALIEEFVTSENSEKINILIQYIAALSNDFQNDVVRAFLHSISQLQPKYIPTIQALLSSKVEDDVLNKLIEIMASAVADFTSDNAYGKLLFKAINLLERHSNSLEQPIKRILGSHKSIWKIKIEKLVGCWFNQNDTLTQSFM
ncbi:hypothetical protein HUJ05_012579 [Dendroctonus ponderosae]|nr:hypothetical protein HUJ05_012579 [Dendroctonus ponderosae]